MKVIYNFLMKISMLLFYLLWGEIQILYHIISVVRYTLWRTLDSNLGICTISPVLLINTPCLESPVKELRTKKRSQE